MIKVFIMDVDGTMTDGKIYMGPFGESMKAFDIKDGYGIHEILPAHGVKTVIVTGRESDIVINRARELEVDYVFQNIKDKYKCVQDFADNENIDLTEVAYIGDDIIDLKSMKVCGVCGCPCDAANEVQENSTYVCQKKGGDGAVREFIEWLLDNKYLE